MLWLVFTHWLSFTPAWYYVFIFHPPWWVTQCWDVFVIPGAQQAGDAFLAPAASAETLGVQQHTRPEGQLELPDAGLPQQWTCRQRQRYEHSHRHVFLITEDSTLSYDHLTLTDPFVRHSQELTNTSCPLQWAWTPEVFSILCEWVKVSDVEM